MAYDKNEILDCHAFDVYRPCKDCDVLVTNGWTGTLAQMIPVATFSIQDIVWGVVNKIKDEPLLTSTLATHLYDTIVTAFPNRAAEFQVWRDSSEPEKTLYKMVPTYLRAGGTKQDLQNLLIQITS